MITEGFGWPLVCLRRLTYVAEPPSGRAFRSRLRYALLWRDRWSALPLLPAWGGMAANASITTVPLLVLAVGGRWMRRAGRVRRGRCIRCGYDLAGLAGAGCPECGAKG